MATREAGLSDSWSRPVKRSPSPDDGDLAPWVEPAARAGYAAKGFVYAVIGFLAVRVAVGRGGGTGGTREALREVAGGPFGQVIVALLGVGLACYVLWRLIQALLDPEHPDDDSWKRRAMRVFYFGSAVLYGLLAFYALQLMLNAAASTDSGGSTQGGADWLMGNFLGAWVLAAIGVGIVARGLLQFFKAYTQSFSERITSFDLGPARRKWVLTASRVGLTARGVIFGIIGVLMVHAATTGDTSEVRGQEGALELLRGQPWLLGAVGAGLLGYAVYQWVKARYRLIGGVG